MYKLYLSLRYFRSRPINIIPVVCMTLGVMALIVILGVMDGFQAQLRSTLRGTLSDLMIRVYYDSDFEEWEEILLDTPGVRAVAPHLMSFGLITEIPDPPLPGQPERPAFMDGAAVFGIDPDRESQVSNFREYLRWRERGATSGQWVWKPSTPDPDHPFAVLDPQWEDQGLEGIILGRPLADALRVRCPSWQAGADGRLRVHYDRVYVTTMVRAEGGDRKYRAEQLDFVVTGIYESGNGDLDRRTAFMARETARGFFQFSRDPEEIRVELTDYEGMKDAVQKDLTDRAQEIREATIKKGAVWPAYLMPFQVHTWEDERRTFLSAINNEKGLIAIIAGMAFVVTGFMIFSILSMIVTMKTRDIGILKALGASTGGVLRIFLVNGLLVGVVGAGMGLGLGLLFVKHINSIKDFLNRTFGWEPFPSDIYLFHEIPTRVIPTEVAIVTGVALFVALLGAFLPALRAARMDPVESLRYE